MSTEPTVPVKLATMALGWNHPRRGRINELLCDAHQQEVMSALDKLGIGCTVEQVTEPRSCTRCVAKQIGVPTRKYVAMSAEDVTP